MSIKHTFYIALWGLVAFTVGAAIAKFTGFTAVQP
jgi:hypothetical protein